MSDVAREGVGARSLRANVAFNLAGQLGPALAALACVPILARQLPASHFGVLNIAWMVIGYFSLFDFGLGRALTHAIASRRAHAHADDLARLTWTCWLALAALGCVAAGLTLAALPFVHGRLGWAADVGESQTIAVIAWLAAGFPATTLASGFRGLLEAVERFDLVNLVRVPMGFAMFLGPTLLLPFEPSVSSLVGAVMLARIAGAVALYLLCRAAQAQISRPTLPTREALIALASTGGWMTLANLSGALLGYADRFLVSALLPLSVVARYLTPQDAIMRLTILPTALASTLFPAVSVRYAHEPAHVRHLVHRSMEYTWLLLFPTTIVIAAFAPEIVTLWLGAAFAVDAPIVMQWMALGVLANGLALTPFTLLQAAGRMRQAALLQLVQLPLLVLALVVALRTGGAPAAAACVAARLLIDCLILVAVSHRVLPGTQRYVIGTAMALLGAAAVFAGFTVIHTIGQRLMLAAVALGASLPALWATGVLHSLPGARRLGASHP